MVFMIYYMQLHDNPPVLASMTASDFEVNFSLLSGGRLPFPWQRRLYEGFVAGQIPKACDLPTGLGKTLVILLWLLALAENPRLPRRLVYVVNRRTVVDQATAEVEGLCSALAQPGAIRDALVRLCAEAPLDGEAPLVVSTLRGEMADNAEWQRDPARPSVVVGTVDMVGSRLLFSGYGCGFRSRPLHAGLLGQDALLVHDEAHLEPAFQQLIRSIREEQLTSGEPRPLQVMALSATGRERADFGLAPEDERHEIVRNRLHARKGLRFHAVADRSELPARMTECALEMEGKVVVFLSSVEHAEKCAAALRNAKRNVVALTGTLRGQERDHLTRNPVFARFLPRLPDGVVPQDGPVYLVATSAGEVGVDISGSDMVSDASTFDSMAQRLGRINRYGEGDARVEVFFEPLKGLPVAQGATDEKEDGEDDDSVAGRESEYDWARFATKELLSLLPRREDGRLDASPAALRALPFEARLKASAPSPDIRHVDGMLFDRWSYTTITGSLPGRPPVGEWLHGVQAWEPPRTAVAWRNEVDWLTQEHLGVDNLDEFLADYPLRSREILSDVTARVLKHLKKIAAHDSSSSLRVWLIREDAPASFWLLSELLSQYDPKKRPLLHGATVVLPPKAGGFKDGLFDGGVTGAEDGASDYDIGPLAGEREVLEEVDAAPGPPAGMRLVRAVLRADSDGEPIWWRLYSAPRRVEDEGSRTAQYALTLDTHLQNTEMWAQRIAKRLGLPESQRKALVMAARWHDLGKRRRLWQRSIKNFGESALAKGPMQPSYLGNYRHELGSLHDIQTGHDAAVLSTEEMELALHLVAAHHGRARPHFPPHEAFDPEVHDDVVGALSSEVPRRFDRLQRRYGHWGLAWLESLLRSADVLGSQVEGGV